MLQRPRLNEHCRALLWEGRGVLLMSDERDHLLPLGLYEHLIPLLDGRADLDRITERMEGRAAPAAVWFALHLLEGAGWLEQPADRFSDSGRSPITPAGAAGEPGEGPIALTTLGDIAAGAAVHACRAAGLVLDPDAPLAVVLTDSYLRPELADLDEEERRAGRTWLPARCHGAVLWLGPRFRPRHGPCWQCLEARLRRNHPHEYRLLRSPAALPLKAGAEPRSGDALTACAALLAQRLGDPALDQSVLRVDLVTGAARRHRLVRRPQCPGCGDPSLYGRIVLGRGLPCSRPVDPAALVDPLFGVCAELRSVAPADGSVLRVWTARYGADPRQEDFRLSETGMHRALGKGAGDADARAGAVAEAVERYCGAFQGDEPRIRASLLSLGASAIHPNACMQFSERQYGCRTDPRMPRPLDPAEPIEWTPVMPLAAGERKFLPTSLLYSGYPSRGDPLCLSDPSGGAAGRSRNEALLNGLLELIERDSLAIWWYNRLTRPGVYLADLSDRCSQGIPAHHRAHGREVWALDLTSDLGIPVFAALSRRIDAGPERIVLGFGAHLDPAVALGRAIAEMDQVLCAVTEEERAGKLRPDLRHWLEEATLNGHPYLRAAFMLTRRIEDVPTLTTGDTRGDLQVCARVLRHRGMSAYWLDQTRPDLGVPVVKVVVPGLRHFRARYAPGRLYSVPVEGGWLERPRDETELNPIEFFL